MGSVCFSGGDIGTANARKRRYATADNHDTTMATAPFDLLNFGKVSFKKVMADGNMYFAAQPAIVDSYATSGLTR